MERAPHHLDILGIGSQEIASGYALMFIQILTIVVPIFFVLLLGYAAGHAKTFSRDLVAGITELVLNFALPATLFVGTVSTPRTQLLQQGSLFLALLLSVGGLYVIGFFLGRLLFRHTVAGAALQATMVSFAAGPFFGPAVLSGVYGASSATAASLRAHLRDRLGTGERRGSAG